MQLYTALTQAFTTHCKGGCSSFLRSFHHHDQFTMKGSHGRLYKHLCRGCITITTGVETACTVHFKEELRVCIGTEIAIFVYHTHCDESQVGVSVARPSVSTGVAVSWVRSVTNSK